MNVKAALATLLSCATIGLLADSAMAKEVSIKGNSQTQVEGRCNESRAHIGPRPWAVLMAA